MSQQMPLHVLRPGQQLAVGFREATGRVLENLKKMRLTPFGGNADPLVHVTFVDALGVSMYIAAITENDTLLSDWFRVRKGHGPDQLHLQQRHGWLCVLGVLDGRV